MSRRAALWSVFVLASLAATVATRHYFAEAFPLVSIDLRMDREQALRSAGDLAARHHLGPPGIPPGRHVRRRQRSADVRGAGSGRQGGVRADDPRRPLRSLHLARAALPRARPARDVDPVHARPAPRTGSPRSCPKTRPAHASILPPPAVSPSGAPPRGRCRSPISRSSSRPRKRSPAAAWTTRSCTSGPTALATRDTASGW